MTAWKTTTAWAMAIVTIAGLGGGVWALTASHDGQSATAKVPERIQREVPPSGDTTRNDVPKPTADGAQQLAADPKVDVDARLADETEKRAIKAKQLQKEQLAKLVFDLESQAQDYHRKYLTLKQIEGFPEYDSKLLVDAIAKIDAKRLDAEEANNPKRDEELKWLNERRKVLVVRLMKQELDKIDRNRQLEDVERNRTRADHMAKEFRTRLEYLKLDLAPPSSAAPADENIERLVKEVADLKNEVRKLAESKK